MCIRTFISNGGSDFSCSIPQMAIITLAVIGQAVRRGSARQ